jgi:hypothetical protein
MPTSRRPPLSQKSLDYMRSRFNPPIPPPERRTPQQRIASLLERTKIIAAIGLALCFLIGPLIWLADLVLATEGLYIWSQVFATFLLLSLLSLLPERIRTAPVKAALLGIGILTLAHALYVAILQQQSTLGLPRTLMIAAGLLFLWKAIDLHHEHTQQPTFGSLVLAALSLIGGIASLCIAALYAYPALINMTAEQLEGYRFPTFAMLAYGLISIIHSEGTTAKNPSGKTSS